jgi:Holliday junction resolvasome RuvABC endonuclease subunit
MNHTNRSGLVLAVHPTSRGFGWVLFEGPLVPVDWGIASAKINKSERSMARFKQLLDQYQPSVLVLEKFEEDNSNRGECIRTLAQTMRGFADNRDMDTPIYGREEVRATVTGNAKANRHAVARAVAQRLPILRNRLPEARKLWQSEDNRQCLFDAAALGITHDILTRPRS